MSPDLLVNLIVAPITFLLLVYVRERLRRIFMPRGAWEHTRVAAPREGR